MAGKQATSVAAGAENPWKKKSFANLFHSNEPAAAAPTVKPIQTYKKEPTLILEEEDIFSLADYMRIWLQGQWTFQGFPMRLFKWSPKFHNLPIHLFQKATLFSFASAIGKPLKSDGPTAKPTRPSIARVCTKLDLLKPHVHRIWIGTPSGKGFWQPVGYEGIPSYYSSCRRLGHSMEASVEENADSTPAGQKLDDALIPLPTGQLFDDIQFTPNPQQYEPVVVFDSEMQHGNDTNPLLLLGAAASLSVG
ncbi:hypothetical protein M9H77_34885 [Catharanthus roseus]|uniref:Uncharacterized protein n=1 Tax=Catharanthus roseus TaxID=4058 RepID=A0ACB9ZR23_CATRO|nr:hypothetical protein M9H77_34885 [Catharanthus roseus]